MKRFRKILLVCDEDGIHETVISRAIWLAKKNNARIHLVDVLDTEPGDLAKLFAALPGYRARDFEFEVLGIRQARLAEFASAVRNEGVDTSECVLQGRPFVEIIRMVLRDGYDLVMKGAAGERNGGSPFFASTDLHLLRKCPCPVWIMKAGERDQFAQILAAVDPDPSNDQAQYLNTLIMDLATSLSDLDQSELHVVNVWQLDEEQTLRHSGFSRVSETELDMLLERKRVLSETWLNDLVRKYPDHASSKQIHLMKGAAQEVIPDFAEKQGIDLIVMGTVGRTGIQGLIIGNTAESILGQVECSVLAVKPPGFETPVGLDQDAELAAKTAAE